MNIAIENDLTQAYRSNPTKQKDPVSTASSATGISEADAQVQQNISTGLSNVDRVEISDEGRAALANMAVVSTDSPQSTEAESRAQEEAAKLMQSLEQNLSGTKDAKGAKGAPPSEMSQAAEKAQESTTAESLEFSLETQEADADEAVIESAESSESSTENLTNLTEQQIEDLVSKGTITQSQANTELSRRKAATESQDTSATQVMQEAATAEEEA